SDPTPNTGSRIVVTFGARHVNSWAGSIVSTQGSTLTLSITPSPKSIVGKFRTYVAIDAGTMQHTPRNTSTDMYVLFNAWCQDDTVFFPEDAGRSEYVLADYGIIYQGAVGAISGRGWMYGQYERGVLDACISILDASHMPISDRGNVIKMVRMGSAMLNAQDDSGVLVGNWSDDYSLGTDPTMWTGSVKILLQYASTKVSVPFGQCWVFAGCFNT
ncbi:coagulation factor XIII A chain-like, partial [Scomber scombrus]